MYKVVILTDFCINKYLLGNYIILGNKKRGEEPWPLNIRTQNLTRRLGVTYRERETCLALPDKERQSATRDTDCKCSKEVRGHQIPCAYPRGHRLGGEESISAGS
jgi:hypothetical protein